MLTAMPQLAVGLELLAKAFEKFGKGMLYLAGAGAIFGALALFADPLCTAIINAAPDIEDALVAVVTLICNAINQSAEPIGEAFTTLGWLGTFLVMGAVVMVILSKDKLRPAKTEQLEKQPEERPEEQLAERASA